jgi:CO/xanthine dehydrogenase Mo-binding subunit
MTKVFRNDARAKVTGIAKYTDDYTLPGMLHAAPVYPNCASARILKIDPAPALALQGVVAVFTAQDIPGSIKSGQIIRDYPTLAHKTVRTTGDVLALVVAESRELALKAAKLVRVELEMRPALLDPEEALKESAP